MYDLILVRSTVNVYLYYVLPGVKQEKKTDNPQPNPKPKPNPNSNPHDDEFRV